VQFESLDLSGLVVHEDLYHDDTLLQSTISTDYSLTWEDAQTSATNGEAMLVLGTRTLLIAKDNFVNTSLTLTINRPTTLTDKLQVTSPTKTAFSVNDALDLSGLGVTLITTYTGSDAKHHNFSQTLSDSDYTLTLTTPFSSVIKNVKNYVMATAGAYKVKVSAEGWAGTVTSSFIVTASRNITGPTTYKDSTIDWKTDDKTMTVSITNPNATNINTPTDKGYYSPNEVSCDFNIYDYSKRSADNWVYTKPKGKSPFLIVPVVFSDSSESKTMANQDNWNTIQKAFFGNSTDLRFESLHSYYYQSSYGQLDLTGTVTDYYYPTRYTAASLGENAVAGLAQDAANWAKSTYNLDMSQYDSDENGMIDGMWMIYMYPTNSDSVFWAFSSTTGNTGTHANPTVNNFGWAGIEFLLRSKGYQDYPCDAHVLIHETGHMLGLMDYYSYSYANDYDAMGGVDMMDLNLGDHNPYSKMLYGWVKPYVVYGNATITLQSSQFKDALIVIPYDGRRYQKNTDGKVVFNMFDEYLVLDYYTDQNMNGLDYDVYGADHVAGRGGRLYHVDNRLSQYTGGAQSLFSNPDTPLSTTTANLSKAITNSESGDYAETGQYYALENGINAWDEIRRISADKRYLGSSARAKTSSLFQTGNTFSVSDYDAQFVSGTFDNGKACSYSVSFTNVATA
jgi:M6 family metalloprotease-like protein